MRGRKITLKSEKISPAFGNGFLDSAFSAHRKEMEFFEMTFDNESVNTKYDKKLLLQD